MIWSYKLHLDKKNLVEGFSVDMCTPSVACNESKQSVEPFGQQTDQKTEPGELTHIDLPGVPYSPGHETQGDPY